ncbi:MAG: hypothetical protein ABSA13_12430 [Beijerinckiaceae bacterium]
MISRMTIPAGLLVAAVCVLGTIPSSIAQVAGNQVTGSQAAGSGVAADDSLGLRGAAGTPKAVAKPVKKPAPPRIAKTAQAKTAQAKPADKPKEMEPWAAVDPTRAGLVDEKAATTAPMPGVAHPAPSSEGPISTGMKWSSSNAPNYGPMSTSGLMNEYNANVNGNPDPGTTAEAGVKFRF